MHIDENRSRQSHTLRRVANEERLIALGREVDGRTTIPASPSRRRSPLSGVEGNARLTASVAAVIFVLLAIEGVTILRIRNLLDVHVFIGVVLIPLVVVKISSTGWRFVRYYAGAPEYRRRGPPAMVFRLLGPVVVVLTVVLFASGVGLVALLPSSLRQELFFVHRASFILWIVVMTLHVLGHLGETMRLAPRDWLLRTRRQVSGASTRQWILAFSVVLGALGAVALTPHAYGWFSP